MTIEVDDDDRFFYQGRQYVLVPNPRYIENDILAGRAILVDVGEELLMYAVPARVG